MKTTRLTAFLVSLLLLPALVMAQAPVGYYNAAVGKTEATLRTSLQSIITSGHRVTSYAGLYTAYSTTDINPTTGKLWDMYSNCSFTIGADENHGVTGAECTNYNREHTTPQSWFSGASPMYSDLFNVYPTDTKVNGARANYPYGEVGTATYTSGNGSKLGSSNFAGYTGVVFEPINEYKGDFARTYLYMATRYAGLCENWTGEATAVYGSSLGFTTYGINLFLKWSRQDPVSEKEIARNNAVYTIQQNRNPFIDHPELAEYIWGNKKGSPWSLSAGVSIVSLIFSITPNLVQNQLTVKCDGQNLDYCIFNLNGQVVQENTLALSRNISVSSLENGMYFLQLKSGNRKGVQKFIVNK